MHDNLNYTAEPIYSYMIGKDARHSQVSISKNDHPQISPRKPGLDHNDPGSYMIPTRWCHNMIHRWC